MDMDSGATGLQENVADKDQNSDGDEDAMPALEVCGGDGDGCDSNTANVAHRPSSSCSSIVEEVGAGDSDQEFVVGRMAKFWAEVHNKVTSTDELLAAWTKNIEDIQEEFTATKIKQELAEAINDEENMSNGDNVSGKPPRPRSSEPELYPKWISLDHVPPEPVLKDANLHGGPRTASPLVETPGTSIASSLSRLSHGHSQYSIEEMVDPEDPRLSLHRTAGQIDIRQRRSHRRESGRVTSPRNSFDSGGGDHWQNVEICELFVHPNATVTTKATGRGVMSLKHNRNQDHDGNYEVDVDVDEDEELSSISTDTDDFFKYGGKRNGVASDRASTTVTGNGDVLREWFKARVAAAAVQPVQSANRNFIAGDPGKEAADSQEDSESNAAPLVMDVEDYLPGPKTRGSGSRLRRMFSLTSVCNRIQGLVSRSRVQPPCCTSKSVLVVENPNYTGKVNDGDEENEDEPEQFGYGVWRNVKF